MQGLNETCGLEELEGKKIMYIFKDREKAKEIAKQCRLTNQSGGTHMGANLRLFRHRFAGNKETRLRM